MKLEVELKAYADDLKGLAVMLEDAGALLKVEQSEFDSYYSHPNRDFGKTDEALRLRIITKEKEGLGETYDRIMPGGTFELSYKGPKIDPQTKTREEYTIKLDDLTNADKILLKLGFTKIMDVKKRRSIYDYKGYTVCLDNVENLGTFIEIEKIISSTDDLTEAKSEITSIFKNLLRTELFERKSYMELLMDKD